MTDGKTLTRGQWMALTAAFLGWMFDGLEMGLFPIIGRPALQDLLGVTDDNLVGLWNGRIVACFLFGAASGGLVFGWLGDRIGRIRSMILSILTYSLFTGCCYFASAPWHLGAFRFLSALGMGGEWSLGVALVMECWPERHRPLLAGLIGAASNVGFLLIAALGACFHVTTSSWRWMTLAGAAPALLTLFIRLSVPESARWKAAVEQKRSKPIREIFARGMAKTTLLAIVLASIPLIGTWAAISGWLPFWGDQLAEKPIAETIRTGLLPSVSVRLADERIADKLLPPDRTVALPDERARLVGDQEVELIKCVALAKDGPAAARAVASRLQKTQLSDPAQQNRVGELIAEQLAKDPAVRDRLVALKKQAAPAKAITQVAVSIGAIIGCIVAAVIGGRIGRRAGYFGLSLLSLAVCAFLFRVLNTYDALFVVTAGVAGAVTAAFYGWLPLYLPELFPTRMRATGQGLSFNFGRILAGVGALQMGQLVHFLGGSYAGAGATATLIYTLGLFLAWLAPETKGKPLPE